jgi:hypothetical protein
MTQHGYIFHSNIYWTRKLVSVLFYSVLPKKGKDTDDFIILLPGDGKYCVVDICINLLVLQYKYHTFLSLRKPSHVSCNINILLFHFYIHKSLPIMIGVCVLFCGRVTGWSTFISKQEITIEELVQAEMYWYT